MLGNPKPGQAGFLKTLDAQVLGSTLKNTIYLAAWQGVDVVVKCASVTDGGWPWRNKGLLLWRMLCSLQEFYARVPWKGR